MSSLIFMFFCSLIEELCTKEENYKTSCNFNFGYECIFNKKLNSVINLKIMPDLKIIQKSNLLFYITYFVQIPYT